MSLARLENLFQHVNERCILQNISLDIEEGESFALLGPNGAGKTMLLRLIMGLDRPSSGEITVFGKQYSLLSDQEMREIRARIGMVVQGGSLLNSLTVIENLVLPLRAFGDSAAMMRRKARLIMTQLRLDGLENQRPNGLSGGLARKVELARALITRPALLLWDELLDGLDPGSTLEIQEHLERERKNGDMTLLYTTHQTGSPVAIPHRIGVLDHGRMLFTGTPGELAGIGPQNEDLYYALKGHL